MSDPFLAEIRIFGGDYAIEDWAYCDGGLVDIRQNTALFSVIGTAFGGNGTTTFALPDLRARAAMHEGTGPGLSRRDIGGMAGSVTERLSEAQMPAHTHDPWKNSTDVPTSNAPQGLYPNRHVDDSAKAKIFKINPDVNATFAQEQIGKTGGTQAHYNRQPYLGMNFIIALIGEYPQRP